MENKKVYKKNFWLRVAAFCMALCISCFAVFRPLNVYAAGYNRNGWVSGGQTGLNIDYNVSIDNLAVTWLGDGPSSERKYYTVSFDVNPTFQFLYTNNVYGKTMSGYHMYDFNLSYSTRSSSYNNSLVGFGTTAEGVSFSAYYSNGHLYVITLFNEYPVVETARGDHLVTGSTGVTLSGQMAAASGTLGSASFALEYTTGSSNYVVGGTIAEAIAEGINNSSDINEILVLLRAISNNTVLLSEVASKLDTANTALQTIISQITEENSSFYWLLVSAIKAANDSQSPNVQEQETQIEELGNKFAQAESEEAAIVLDAQTAFGNIDFAPVAPTGVAGAAPWVVGFIYDIWNHMGPLQYLMTVGLTIGLAFLFIGFINRVHKK